MAVPDFQTIMLPLLKFAGDRREHSTSEAIDALATDFRLTEEDRKELLPSGRQASTYATGSVPMARSDCGASNGSEKMPPHSMMANQMASINTRG